MTSIRGYVGSLNLVVAATAILLFGAGCSTTPEITDGGGSTSYQLKLIGSSIEDINLGDSSSVRVILCESTEKGCKVLSGKEIQFQLMGNVYDTTIEKQALSTDETGSAAVTVKIGTNPELARIQKVQVLVSTTAYAKVEPVTKTFQVRESRMIIVLPDGEVRNLNKGLKTSQLMKVDYTQSEAGTERLIPVPNQSLHFKILKGDTETKPCYFDDTPGKTETDVVTNAMGVSNVPFFTGNVVGTHYIYVSGATAAEVQMTIIVQENGSPECKTSRDCVKGKVCRDGQCVPEREPCDAISNPCPSGYLCVDGDCYMKATCPDGWELVEESGTKVRCKLKDHPCKKDEDCPEGLVCRDGQCVTCLTDAECPPPLKCIDGQCRDPGQCPGLDKLDVTGVWYTNHMFKTDAALAGFPKLAGPIDIINQALMGDLTAVCGNIPFICPVLGKLVEALVKQYVPPWAPKLVASLNSLANLFSEGMKVQGDMMLQRSGLLMGTENWQSAVMCFIQNCPKGRQDPNFPKCCEIDVIFNQGTNGIKVKEVKPFTAQVDCDVLTVNERQVDMEVGKLINYMVTMVVQISTGYNTLEDAVNAMVDCPALAQNAASSWCKFSGCDVLIETACEAAKATLPAALTAWLDQQSTSWTTFTFHGNAKIKDTGTDQRADELNDGKWEGTIKVLLDGDLKDSTWNATRN
ncbi:MAG: EB domain-containing protein [Myxococcota bacterium]